jgi:hypothetical protein
MSDDFIEVPYDSAAILTVASHIIRDSLESPRDNRKIRASMVGKCPREIAHAILDSPKQPLSAHQHFTFLQGHALGDYMTFKLIKWGWVKAEPFINSEGELDWRGNTEEQVEDENFKGHYDIFTEPLKHEKITYKGKTYSLVKPTTAEDPEGKRYLLDFKTMSDRPGIMWPKDPEGNPIISRERTLKGFDYYRGFAMYDRERREGYSMVFPGKFTKLKGIPYDYWAQLHVYARIKKADGVMLFVMARDADEKLLYKNKDNPLNCPIKIFTTTDISEETLRELDIKAEYIYSHTRKNNLPPIPEEFAEGPRFPCGYCAYNFLCFENKYPKKLGLAEVRPFALEDLKIKKAA